jgi:hypothetical protein
MGLLMPSEPMKLGKSYIEDHWDILLWERGEERDFGGVTNSSQKT